MDLNNIDDETEIARMLKLKKQLITQQARLIEILAEEDQAIVKITVEQERRKAQIKLNSKSNERKR